MIILVYFIKKQNLDTMHVLIGKKPMGYCARKPIENCCYLQLHRLQFLQAAIR